MGLSWKAGQKHAELLITALHRCILAESSAWENKVYWDEGGLRVKNVKLKDLALLTQQYGQNIDSEAVRNALRCLKELNILEDHRSLVTPSRTKTGSDQWNFLVKLPDDDIKINIKWLFGDQIEQKQGEWDKRKQAQNLPFNSNQLSTSTGRVAEEVLPLSKEQLPLFYYLPHPKYTKFIGRKRTLPLLLKHISINSNISQIIITGIGGIGKTSLALEAAYYCLKLSQEKSDKNYQFDGIIFASFKQQKITNQAQIIQHDQKQLSCQEIINRIVIALNKKELFQLDFKSCVSEIINLLTQNKYKILLIVDNLETVEDLNNTIWFLDQLPNTVKVVITSREEKGFGQVNISLDTLNKSALELIQYESELQNITLTPEEYSQIYDKTCRIPLAIILVLGQLASHYSFKYVIENLSNGSNDIVRYCFESSVRPLKGKSSYQLLTTLALFSKIPSDTIISEIANVIDDKPREIGFTELQQLRLIQRFSKRYEMLSLIRTYVLAELKNDFEWESELRNRWVNWYKEFVRQYGGQNEKEWNNYEQLEAEWENITDVITWCINHNRYDDVKCFWQGIKGYSHVRGYQSDRLIGWNSRLEWTDWLITNARDNKDYATTVEVMFDRAWTLTLIGKPETLEQATRLFAQTWSLRKHHHNRIFQIDLAIHIAYFRFFQQKIKQAKQWLNYAKKLLEQSQSNLDNSSTSYQYILWYYYQGRIEFDGGDYLSAQQSFSKVLELATRIPHQRGISLAQRWLGNVAIELYDFDDAQKIFTENLSLTKANKDRVGEAFCQQALAFLAKKIGNMTECNHWAKEAISTFQDLGMMQEVKTTQDRLNQLET